MAELDSSIIFGICRGQKRLIGGDLVVLDENGVKDGTLTGVTVLDRNPISRDVTRRLVEQEHDLEVVALVEDCASAVAAVTLRAPDVLVVDWSSVDDVGAQTLLEAASNADVTCEVLALVEDHAGQEDLAPVWAGASGMLVKDVTLAGELVHAIRALTAGGSVVPLRLLRHQLDRERAERAGAAAVADSISGLTSREYEVLVLLGRPDISGADIAEVLGISPKTVKTHIGKILRKLGLHTRADAARIARGLLEQRVSPNGSSPTG